MDTNWFEFLGYLASFLVLVSLLMSSIVKLRWINLLGSGIFTIYGFLIGAFPVAFMNLCTCFINIYYLVKIYRTKEHFKILPIEMDSEYFQYFIDFHRKDIEKYEHKSQFDSGNTSICICILRNLVPAGIFIASKHDGSTLRVDLDFVIPEYRDFKVGTFIYENSRSYFLEKGYSRFISYSKNPSHVKYLKKMGFKEVTENGSSYFIKEILLL